MALGIEGYGSDDDSGDEVTPPSTLAPKIVQKKVSPPLAPAPSTGGLQLPAPKSNRRREGPVKIKVEILQPNDTSKDDVAPPAKKLKLPDTATSTTRTAGAGSSSLLSMLPAPKKTAINLPKPKTARVLGGGAASSSDNPGVIMDSLPFDDEGPSASIVSDEPTPAVTSFMPSSIVRPKSKASVVPSKSIIPQSSVSAPAKPAVDFFSLGAPSSSRSPPPPLMTSIPSASGPSSLTPSVTISSAPVVAEYQPPPPTPQDPYPGYYQKPSGEWAAYDTDYYMTFWNAWQAQNGGPAESDDKGKRKERGWEGADDPDMLNVDASEEMKRGQIAQREAQKNLTGGPSAAALAESGPKMNIKAKAGGRARQKGQLSSLLAEAYENRAALEERIAAGRRNRKEAGNKYGF